MPLSPVPKYVQTEVSGYRQNPVESGTCLDWKFRQLFVKEEDERHLFAAATVKELMKTLIEADFRHEQVYECQLMERT